MGTQNERQTQAYRARRQGSRHDLEIPDLQLQRARELALRGEDEIG